MILEFLIALPLVTVAGESEMNTWVQCSLNDVPALKRSGIALHTKPVKSMLACTMMAAFHGRAELFCFSMAGADGAPECKVWDDGAIISGDVIREPSSGLETCLTLIPESRFFSVQPQCPEPYYMTSFGCILVDVNRDQFTNARIACQDRGDDLFVAKDVAEFDALAQHLLLYYGKSYANLWVGMRTQGTGNWRWQSGREVNITEECPDCSRAFLCARMNKPRDFKLREGPCAMKLGHVCRKV